MSLFDQSRTHPARKSAFSTVSSSHAQPDANDGLLKQASTSHSLTHIPITREEVVPVPDSQLRTHIREARGGGHPLTRHARKVLEPGVGYDLSAVRVHHNAQADQMAHSVHARACTSGNIGQVIQRAVDAKASLVQAPASTGEVPDLPSAIVSDLTDASKSTAKDAERQKILDDIYLHLQGSAKSIIDNVDKLDYGGDNKATYGLTTEIPNQQQKFDNRAKVEIFSAAFDSGPAVVYSTIRHELIHAEQYRQPPSANPANDPFFYAARAKSGDKNVLKGGTGTEQALKHVLDEIETYAWEIEHASETGAQQAHQNKTTLPYVQGITYVEERTKELGTLYNNLIKYSEELTVKKQPKWQGLVAKAVQMVENAMISQKVPFVKKTIKWRVDQPKQPKNPQIAKASQQRSGGVSTLKMKGMKNNP